MSTDGEEQPRAWTAEEMSETVLGNMKMLAHYWSRCDLSRPEFRDVVAKTGETLYRLEGLLHSILCMFDGCGATPALSIKAAPHPDDRAFHEENGDNWWPSDVEFSISHDHLYRERRDDPPSMIQDEFDRHVAANTVPALVASLLNVQGIAIGMIGNDGEASVHYAANKDSSPLVHAAIERTVEVIRKSLKETLDGIHHKR
jgi:hypothetical protein